MEISKKQLLVQKISLKRKKQLKEKFGNFYNFLLLSLASRIAASVFDIAIFDEEQVVIVSSNEKDTKTFQQRETIIAQMQFQKEAAIEIKDISKSNLVNVSNDFKYLYFKGFPILNVEQKVIGSLNIFNEKEMDFDEKEMEILQISIDQISQLINARIDRDLLQNYQRLFHVSSDLIGIVNFQGKFIKLNPAFSKTFGWSDEEIIGNDFMNFIHPEDRARSQEAMKDLESGKTLSNFMNRYVSKNEAIKWIEWTSTPEIETGLIYVIGRDVTEFIERKMMLEKSEQKFRNLFENVQGILSIHDLEGNFIEVNQAGIIASGFSAEEMHKGSIFDIVSKDKANNVHEYLHKIRQDGYASGEMQVVKKDRSTAVWMFMSKLDSYDDKQFIITNAVDITERIRLDNDLKAAKSEAEHAYKVKSEFIANMSHELRTPLNGIIGFTELALKTNLDETQQQYLNIINQSGAALFTIINDILDFSKMESKKMGLVLEKVEIQEVANDSFSLVSYSIDKKNLEMLMQIDPQLPKYVYADAMRLKQIFVNLLSNAVKFTEKGEISLYIKVLEIRGDDKMLLRCGVKDTGIGVAKEKQQEIFKAFAQEDGSITKKYGGTGLGLTITNRLLALRDSSLQLDSEQGVGSDFYFDIEFKVEAGEMEDWDFEGIKKVLIVDDNKNNRSIIKGILQLKDMEVAEAESGLQALIMMQSVSDYDVIIMDYHMPIMDGVETIRKIKAMENYNSKDISPFIVLYSSSDDTNLQAACDELAIIHRLVKPIRMNQIYESLSNLKNSIPERVNPIRTKEMETLKSSMTILIAEDNMINMLLVATYLKQLLPQARIIKATDGKEAIDLYFKEQPNLVLMDIQMPNVNGLEATKIIRAEEKEIHVPIIALTAGSFAGEKERCLDAGMDDFIAKPFMIQTLAQILQKWVGKTEIN